MIDFKDQNQLYQLIAGLSGFTIILIGCLVIMAPFFPAFLLATIFSLATWPAFTWLNRRLHSRTALSATIMTFFLTCCFIFPLVIIGTSIVESFTKVYDAVQQVLHNNTGETADMLRGMPFGDYLAKTWVFLAKDKANLSAELQEYAAPTSQKLIYMGGVIGRGLMDISLGVLISYFFFRYGTRVAVRLDNLIKRFAGERGERILDISKNTLIGVVYGVLGTALAQGALGAIGFWIANVPGATFLGLLTFFLSFIPMGSLMILLPGALWVWLVQGNVALGIGLFLWGLCVGFIDKVIQPYFIGRSSNLPLILVLLGVMGGMMAFGFIGVFIGPTILAVAYSLILEWSNTRQENMKLAGE